MMRKRILAGILAVSMVFGIVTMVHTNGYTVQAAETEQKYRLDVSLADESDFSEICVGDRVEAYGWFYDSNGETMAVEDWSFFSDDEMAQILGDSPVIYYSKYDNVEDAKKDMTPIDVYVPEAAFGKYVYKWVGAYLKSDVEKMDMRLVRSNYTVTSWAGSDPYTVSLRDDGKSVKIWSIWSCQNAVLPSKVTINGKKYPVKEISAYALEVKDELESVTIPSSITMIGENAFNGATKLKTIKFLGKVDSVGSKAFYGIQKNAVFQIKANEKEYNKLVKQIRKSGVAKTVKFKKVKK